MTIEWSPLALRDLVAIHKHIEQDNSEAARRTIAIIINIVSEQISQFPELGHHGRVVRADCTRHQTDVTGADLLPANARWSFDRQRHASVLSDQVPHHGCRC